MRSVVKIEDPHLDRSSWSKVKTCGNVIEVLTMQRTPKGCPCKKLDSDHYMDVRDGLVYEYEHAENKAECIESVRKTMQRIRDTINSNVTDPVTCKFVTITYAENMMDAKQLYSDLDKFWKRMQTYFARNNIPCPEYINVIEPQGRGAWHAHCLWIWSCKAPFIANAAIESIWKHGFTRTKGVTSCDNIGAYFSAYLADMPLSDFEKLDLSDQAAASRYITDIVEKTIDEDGVSIPKKFVKGARLFMYPPGMNIIRTSRGIRKPDIEVTTLVQAEKKVSAATETFRTAFSIQTDGESVNTIVKQYYNTKRAKIQ